MIYPNTLSHIEQEFARSYDVSSTIRHKGEKGRQRENGLARLLKEHLPLAYGIATGEIIPHSGDMPSPQCDIIIYDHLHYPILGRNDVVQQVPLEAVYCVIEAKSVLDMKEIEDAKRKFVAIQAMPRYVPHKNTAMRGSSNKSHKMQNDDIAYITFGYKSKLSLAKLQEVQSAIVYNYAIAALDRGVGFAIGKKRNERHLWFHARSNDGVYRTLATLFLVIMENLKNTNLGEPDYFRLLLGL